MKFKSNVLYSTILPGVAASEVTESKSDILAGNLEQDFSEDDDEIDQDINIDAFARESEFEGNEVTIDDVERVDEMIRESLGIENTLKNFIVLVLSGSISVSEILVQAFAYKVQIFSHGRHSVRYADSYGMFWAGVRNLVKTRGLVAIREHIPVPASLSTMKKKIIDYCQLDSSSLGKSGLQKRILELWIQSKQAEIGNKQLCVSLAADAKKISASAEGHEDLSGLGGRETTSDEWKHYEKYKREMLDILVTIDTERQSCFYLYDKLTVEAAKLVNKLCEIDKLILRNSKLMEKNPAITKYIYILEKQKREGLKLLDQVLALQQTLILSISRSRNCAEFLPECNSGMLDLGSQMNYYSISIHDNDKKFSKRIKSIVSGVSKRINVNWRELYSRIPVAFCLLGIESDSARALFDLCYLKDDSVFKACGLSKQRPVAEMKDFFMYASNCSFSSENLQRLDCKIRAVVSSNFSSITFGRNRIIRDGGLFVDQGICSVPELVVIKCLENNEIEYSVKVFQVESNPFSISDDHLVSALTCATLANASKGSLLLLNSGPLCVIFEVTRDDVIVNMMFTLIRSYVTASQCISKRSKEMIAKSGAIQDYLEKLAKKVVTLGSYPGIKEVYEAERTEVVGKTNLMKPNLRIVSGVNAIDKVS